jgi:hypothetical protein
MPIPEKDKSDIDKEGEGRKEQDPRPIPGSNLHKIGGDPDYENGKTTSPP